MFNGERLKQAREVAGLTQEALAQAAQRDQSIVSLYEQNARQPTEDVEERLALATGFPRAFFHQESGPDFPLGSILFRKKSGLPVADTNRVRQTARLILQLFLRVEARFKALPVTIPRVGDVDPMTAAEMARSALGYSPDGPIRGLLTRLERAGILVFRLPVAIAGFDAFSAWSPEHDKRPVIALGRGASGERDRATLAHELAHLFLHLSFLGDLGKVESEGRAFGEEFLMPANDVRQEFGEKAPLTLTRLADLKSKWGVSIEFILQRLESLRIISPQQKSYWRGRLYKSGWLGTEPRAIAVEHPRLLRSMLEKLYGSPLDSRRLAREMTLPPRLMEDFLSAHANGGSGQLAAPVEPAEDVPAVLIFRR